MILRFIFITTIIILIIENFTHYNEDFLFSYSHIYDEDINNEKENPNIFQTKIIDGNKMGLILAKKNISIYNPNINMIAFDLFLHKNGIDLNHFNYKYNNLFKIENKNIFKLYQNDILKNFKNKINSLVQENKFNTLNKIELTELLIILENKEEFYLLKNSANMLYNSGLSKLNEFSKFINKMNHHYGYKDKNNLYVFTHNIKNKFHSDQFISYSYKTINNKLEEIMKDQYIYKISNADNEININFMRNENLSLEKQNDLDKLKNDIEANEKVLDFLSDDENKALKPSEHMREILAEEIDEK